MQIQDLTKSQIDMLATLWKLESITEVERFRSSLPKSGRHQVDTLIELIRLQSIDDQIDNTDDFAIAKELLSKIM